MGAADEVEYRFVETSTVTDEEITRLANELAAQGWHFDGIHFVVWEGSRRPSMAFLRFTRPRPPGTG